MIGNHSIPVIVEAYNKGFRDWDAVEALNDMVITTDNNDRQQDSYRKLGYIPTGRGVQSVSKVLEYAYDDACIAQFASRLGKTDIAATYAKRSENWRNVYDNETGYVRGRTADGKWQTPFEPNRIDSNNYTEANAWQYTFFVPHNVPGMIANMGGDEKFVAKLDDLFDTKEQMPNKLVDVSGLIGMYAHGNEPVHHVAYLYNYAGQPWKTQARCRFIASTLYTNTVGGLCGNDDCGQMSAWYIFSALGFYPVDPASSVYVIGSPVLDQATIKLNSNTGKGHTFTVVAKGNSSKNIYIQSATLNGKPLSRSWITHDEIVAGGKLVLVMGSEPNRTWGTAPADRPGKLL